MDFGNGDYQALKKIRAEHLTPDQVIDLVTKSGLRGRGGAGFPTGKKWRMLADAPGDVKYVICNGDEGDPGAFMDRAIMEEFPHTILEALQIAGYAVGAKQGVIYVRAEYPVAVARLQAALAQARAAGNLGPDFDITIRLGAGAYVCGEETALIKSVAGQRGEPNPRPPYPTTAGLYGKPTMINNVETLANIPNIILHGPENFANTKIFAVSGAVQKSGLVEVPLGTTINTVVNDLCGGARPGHTIKAVQIGGPSGGCIPASLFDTPLDYESIKNVGAILGSGGLVVLDDTTCMVDFAKFFIKFSGDESCGKCTPCRIGNKKLSELLDKITTGRGTAVDLTEIQSLAQTIADTSLCGLGRSSPTPVLTALRYFPDEFQAHLQGRCPAGVCFKQPQFVITAKCVGCGLCARQCPVQAISGALKSQHHINPALCVKCGLCASLCPVHAITGGQHADHH